MIRSIVLVIRLSGTKTLTFVFAHYNFTHTMFVLSAITFYICTLIDYYFFGSFYFSVIIFYAYFYGKD